RIASVSPTVRRSSIRKPSGRISRAMKARCASCTSPSKSSVPVLRSATRIMQWTINAQRPTLNVQRATLLSIERWKFGVESWAFAGSALCRGLILFLANERKFFAFHYRAIDRDFGDIFPARHIVHDVQHDPLKHGTQRARARSLGDRLGRQCAQCILGDSEAHTLH